MIALTSLACVIFLQNAKMKSEILELKELIYYEKNGLENEVKVELKKGIVKKQQETKATLEANKYASLEKKTKYSYKGILLDNKKTEWKAVYDELFLTGFDKNGSLKTVTVDKDIIELIDGSVYSVEYVIIDKDLNDKYKKGQYVLRFKVPKNEIPKDVEF